MEELLPFIPLFDVDFSKVPKGKYSGVIVESREHPMLELVLKNFVYMLPDWSLTIFHCQKNKEFIEDILSPKSSVKMIQLSVPDLTRKTYSDLLLTEWFYEQIDAEKILIFQCDSFIRKSNIHEFLPYDYVGSFWPPGVARIGGQDVLVGNGGLSLRDRKTVLQVIRNPLPNIDLRFPWPEYDGRLPMLVEVPKEVLTEDMAISFGIHLLGKQCPAHVADAFSAERSLNPDPFGWHQVYIHHPPNWVTLKSIKLDYRAFYGVESRYFEVTGLLTSKGDSINIQGSYNNLFGEPMPNQVKHLKIVSKITVYFQENAPAQICRLVSPPLPSKSIQDHLLDCLFPNFRELESLGLAWM